MSSATMALHGQQLPDPVPNPHRQGELVFERWANCRPQMAAKLATAFVEGQLTERERAVAIEVFKCLARDLEIEVRRALAEHIKASPLLPHSIALQLARDVASVSVPLLQSSPVLTDADLVDIIGDGDPAKQRAIAGRATLSEIVSGALVDTGVKSVIEILLANDGALISDDSYKSLLDSFADDVTIQGLLVERPVLPFAVKERLICLVCSALRARLTDKHNIPDELAEQLSAHGRERTLVQSLAALKSGQEIEAAVERLHRKDGLTPTLLLRTLSLGLFEFFGAGIAALAQVPSGKAQNALRKAGTPALVSLYERAKLPEQLKPAFQIVLEVVLERRRAGHTGNQPEAEMRMVAELARAYRQISPDSLESVIYQLSRLKVEDSDDLRL
jgi:uncharacterized protein (DUF2336 family)